MTDEEASCGYASDAECDDSNPCTTNDCGTDLLCHISPVGDGTPCPTGRCCSRACIGDTSELCNGRDDDCDGGIDEGFTCRLGDARGCTTSCGSSGSQTCGPGCSWGACSPPAETSNGAEDDCDGSTDEGWTCAVGSTGTCTNGCGASGTRTCDASCSWGPCLPAGTSVVCWVCAEDPYCLPSSSPYCGDLDLTGCTLRRSTRVTDEACYDSIDSWERTYCCP